MNQKEKEEYFPVVTRGGILVRPLLTLVLGWESVIADPTCYDVKRGRYTSFRPGLVDLFLACADAQIEIIIWSRDYPSAIVAEDIRSFILKQVIPNDIKRYNDFLEKSQKERIEKEILRKREEEIEIERKKREQERKEEEQEIKKAEKLKKENEEKQKQLCKCGIMIVNICICKNQNYELHKLNNNLFCINCKKWKCRCK